MRPVLLSAESIAAHVNEFEHPNFMHQNKIYDRIVKDDLTKLPDFALSYSEA